MREERWISVPQGRGKRADVHVRMCLCENSWDCRALPSARLGSPLGPWIYVPKGHLSPWVPAFGFQALSCTSRRSHPGAHGLSASLGEDPLFSRLLFPGDDPAILDGMNMEKRLI